MMSDNERLLELREIMYQRAVKAAVMSLERKAGGLEKDCWVSANGKEIVLMPHYFMLHERTKWRESNWEKENGRQ